MENLETISEKAILLAKNGKFKKFFSTIEHVSTEDWLIILFPDKNVEDDIKLEKHFKKKFWKYIVQSSHFSAIPLQNAETLLDAYFKNPRNANQLFNVRIAQIYPDLFIKKFKSTYAIFRKEFIDNVRTFQFAEFSDNSLLKLHTKHWITLHEEEKVIWNTFTENQSIWLELSPIEVLAYACFYIENKAKSQDSSHLYASAFINVLFSYYFFEKRNELDKLELSSPLDEIKNAYLTYQSKPNNIYFTSLDKLANWFLYTNAYDLNTYCFSENYYLTENAGDIDITCKSLSKREAFKKNQIKINLLPILVEELNGVSVNYTTTSSTSPEFSEKKRMQTLGKRQSALDALFDALQYSNYKIDGVNVPIKSISLLVNLLIEDAKKRYVEPKFNKVSRNHTDLKLEKKEEVILPIRILTIEDFNRITRIKGVPEEFVGKILGFQPETFDCPHYFDRFYPFIKMEAQPFFMIGKHVIYFQNFLCNLYNSFKLMDLNLNYHTKKRIKGLQPLRPRKLVQKEDKQFETYFENFLFKNYGFKNLKTTVKIGEGGKPIGEVDVLIFHEGVLMLVELKRTHLRLAMSEAYYQSTVIHQKGANQLNKVIGFLENEENANWIEDNLDIKMAEVKKILPLIISTSLDEDGDKIDGILKQNFFLFNFHATYPTKGNGINHLQQLYDYLERDDFWNRVGEQGYTLNSTLV